MRSLKRIVDPRQCATKTFSVDPLLLHRHEIQRICKPSKHYEHFIPQIISSTTDTTHSPAFNPSRFRTEGSKCYLTSHHVSGVNKIISAINVTSLFMADWRMYAPGNTPSNNYRVVVRSGCLVL